MNLSSPLNSADDVPLCSQWAAPLASSPRRRPVRRPLDVWHCAVLTRALPPVASGEVDVCLIPELPFDVDKVCGFVHTRLKEHGYAIVVVSEGAGQELIEAELEAVRREGDPSHTHHDASGRVAAAAPQQRRRSRSDSPLLLDPARNPVLHDVGRWLVGKIKDYSAKRFDGIVPDVKCAREASCTTLCGS